jgi:hypothetical protein
MGVPFAKWKAKINEGKEGPLHGRTAGHILLASQCGENSEKLGGFNGFDGIK